MKKKPLLKTFWPLIFLVPFFLSQRPIAALDQTYEQIKLLVDIFQHIRQDYVDEVDPKTLIYGAAAGMVSKLDPFSQFLEPEERKEMQTETEGQFGGIGIRITIRDGWLTVITPLPETPAYKAGILPGDKIIRVDGQSTKEMTLTDAVKKLRGAPKSKVMMTIAREGEKEPKDFTIARENIVIQTIRSKMLSDHTGYVRISEFIEPTMRDLD